MNNTIRINTSLYTSDNKTIDNYIKINLEQSFDFIEILSLTITQEDAYRTFCSDYGVIVGRVIINSGFGVPNAKVSIFIPIDDVDSGNSQIKGLYPYEVTSDRNSDGIRYNLLPKQPETNNECFTPIGTFPSKREILDNSDMLEIYNKYYKFTTTTNYAGDFMLFGVPLGTHTIHVDADISDIGIASQRPYDSISQGAPLKMFESSTKFKGGANLDKLVQIKSANAGVNVQPFWGDKDNCQIGISRVDIDLNYNITPSAIFMGSIFGDQDKNSVNKNCDPRKAMGNLCEQVAGEGTIEMIRETLDGSIESFDIDGGRVIDENGSWAYQIPMNLDYMVTDETGNLVLSDDPNKGIPTRANVRFRIGMDQTGGEGRLRTRAKYLVPHNPTIGKMDEIDYEFGEKTKKTSFRNIYWNKIYSVSNFIARYQPTNFVGGKSKITTGIKDVDECVGTKNPFPYNRISVESNALFFIICLIIKFIGFLMALVNSMILPALNFIILVLNGIINVFCEFLNFKLWRRAAAGLRDRLGCHKKGIPSIPCLYASCGSDGDSSIFAPGCFKGEAWDALANSGDGDGAPDYYPDDGIHSFNPFDLVGLDDCVSFQIAAFLNIFEFDFYNDWINGSLYGFLLKYKKKGKKEKFCDYDCSTTSNPCHKSFLSDNNYVSAETGKPDNFHDIALTEGLIKKVNNEFYYAASTRNANNKIFATELINLGSVFNCDWQGVPKLQPFLIETTYKLPPIINELSGDNKTVLTTGQCSLDGNSKGTSLFFDIDCNGLHSNKKHVLNIRHICEFGVELDEYRDGTLADGIIGVRDIDADDGDKPKLFRDIFYGLNINNNTWDIKLPYTTNFNLKNKAEYNFATQFDRGEEVNGADYVKFRGYPPNSTTEFTQPSHSYYFYFGLTPGKTGLNKLNRDFFAICKSSIVKFFDVDIKTVSTTYGVNNNGSATFTFINGAKPISYTVTGPNNYKKTDKAGVNNADPIFTLKNLVTGEYTISATDSLGNVLTETFVISPAPELYADAYVSKNCTSIAIPDGEITITAVGGGNPATNSSYTYVLYNGSGTKVAGPTLFNQIPTIIGGLSVSTQHNLFPFSFGPNVLATNSTITPVSNFNRANLFSTLPTTPVSNFNRANLLSTLPTIKPTTNTYVPIPNLTTYLTIGSYTLVVSDSSNNYVTVKNLVISGPSKITLMATKVDTLCFNDNSGTIDLAVIGGEKPYLFKTTTSNGFSSTSQKVIGLSAGTYTSTVTDKYKITDTVVTTITSQYPEINLVAGSSYELNKQPYSDKYIITLYLKSPYGAGADVNLEFNIDNITDEDNNLLWEPITLKFVNNQTPLIVEIPLDYVSTKYEDTVYEEITDKISFRASNSTKTCHSDSVEIFIEDISLPEISLTLTAGDNIQQNSQYQVKFNFVISYTPEDINSRGPFTTKYTVTGYSHGLSKVSDLNTIKITKNKEIITATVPYVNQYPANDCKVSVTVTDRNGCVSPMLNMNIDLPG